MARSPAWQKCLVLQPAIAAGYDRIVWLDADIVINKEAPAVTSAVPLDKIGAVDEFLYPTLESHQAFWRRMVAQTKDRSPAVARIWQSYLDPADYHGFWGLPRRGNHIVQTGLLVLSPRHHRELLDDVYYTYENKGGPELNYEMRPLSFEIQERHLQHWIDQRFNAVFNAILLRRMPKGGFRRRKSCFRLDPALAALQLFPAFCRSSRDVDGGKNGVVGSGLSRFGTAAAPDTRCSGRLMKLYWHPLKRPAAQVYRAK